MDRAILHIVGGETRPRAELARLAFALGHHAEIYADLEELVRRPPPGGIILVAETGEPDGVRRIQRVLGAVGIGLPVVVTAETITLEQVVAAIRAGALDYLALPLEMGHFARRLANIIEEARPYERQRRLEIEALRQIEQLSSREQDVLALVSAGLANKEIAQRLGISPRTVEVHRSNMMTKLRAGHAADAIKTWLAAGLDCPILIEAAPADRRRAVISQGLAPDEGHRGPRRQRQ